MNIPQTQSAHAERQYLHTMVAGALLPFAQASITALVIAVGVWVIAFFIFDMMDSYKSFIVSFALTWVFVFLRLQRHWLSLTTIERIMQRDINNDGVIGEAPKVEAKPRRIVIQLDQVKENGHYQPGDISSRIEFPGTSEQLEAFAQGMVNGMPITDRAWSGDGKLYTGQEWREMKAEMFKKHGDREPLIEYVNPENKKHGIRLTATGRKFFEEVIADNSPTPS
ncbi:MAG: hypothetical protein HY865_00900 [Chloroflexi bacterium]|nr:hypothetical protein [Chloroflexota bacterium]